ncbi:MAG TPA: LamG-like jellyroll fold domain-containing protein, partial [Methylomirabilota bacterium]|nr:LamG-like jellyroll fold domain-containing protein [Methylomirabilota bacterium]
VQSITTLSSNQFYHVAMTCNSGTLKLYVNGTVENQTVPTFSQCCDAGIGSPLLTFGSQNNTNELFRGIIDEVRIYDRVLSDIEIAQLAVPATPPRITQRPVSQTVGLGTNATLQVAAEGTVPLTYQWFRDNVPVTNSATIASVTASSLTISNAQAQDTGAYFVIVTNAGGSVTSLVAVLTVYDSDTDDDGLPNSWETAFGRNPNNPLDAAENPPGDQLTYLQKYLLGLNPATLDADNDGLTDYADFFIYGTNPLAADTDGDGIPDAWEIANGLNPRANDAHDDLDLDRVSNIQEYQYSIAHTNEPALDPRNPFSRSGVSDYEVFTGGHRATQFYYDRTDRLIGADYNRGSNGFAIAYVYDGNGNMLRQKNLARDANHNGLPDIWEFLHGLTNNASTFADSDGDLTGRIIRNGRRGQIRAMPQVSRDCWAIREPTLPH